MPMRGELIVRRRSGTPTCHAHDDGLNTRQLQPREFELVFWLSTAGLTISLYLLNQFPQYGDMFVKCASLA